jgi:hypothetical protein
VDFTFHDCATSVADNQKPDYTEFEIDAATVVLCGNVMSSATISAPNFGDR